MITDYFKGKTFVIFDLETTDLKTEIAEIIELAALKVVDGVPTETFQTLVKPLATISEEITNITHISNAMVLDAPSIENVMPDFFKFAHGSILCGHNIAGYDYPIIARISEKWAIISTTSFATHFCLQENILRNCRIASSKRFRKPTEFPTKTHTVL